MKVCLLCRQSLKITPSWKSLLRLEEQQVICEKCSEQFERIDVQEKDPLVDQIISLYTYNEAMQDYLHQFKFLQDIALAEIFKEDLKKCLKRDAIIVPIPTHPEKKKQRTFGHVEALLEYAGIPYEDVLEKVNAETMGEKTKAERLAVAQLFRCKSEKMIQPTAYLLVDDIYTTGTTLRHAAAVLKEAGAIRVEAVTLIRAKTDAVK